MTEADEQEAQEFMDWLVPRMVDDWLVDFLRLDGEGNVRQRPPGGWPSHE